MRSCLEGVRALKEEVSSKELPEDSAVDKLRLMSKALKYIDSEKELPKSIKDVELFSELKDEITDLFHSLFK